ncbi:hypothetical protein BJ508DRAFT_51058 [Ascobolus immersus RN42]|uniref:Uncharacterized protein n=1 Tax=Ascobolus immersus RN42 TaxID=1160509 RepID=A0A3N4ICH5_ASCIM|nr:hypothetical protein BJ508DRAFT_51058 [Ascobolus immersus RN42]
MRDRALKLRWEARSMRSNYSHLQKLSMAFKEAKPMITTNYSFALCMVHPLPLLLVVVLALVVLNTETSPSETHRVQSYSLYCFIASLSHSLFAFRTNSWAILSIYTSTSHSPSISTRTSPSPRPARFDASLPRTGKA